MRLDITAGHPLPTKHEGGAFKAKANRGPGKSAIHRSVMMKSKNHILMRMWYYMVEARGVKPLSEGIATKASTGVAT
jgi:hypothetical protein